MDWLKVLDFDRALRNCHFDMLGDWYRDPWGWVEADWCVKNQPDLLVARLNSSGVRRAAKLDVAKENFGIRPAIVMDPLDRVIYQALVDRLSPDLSKGMRPWVYGWRLDRTGPQRGDYLHNGSEWTSFLATLTGQADIQQCVLKTDVVSFFASVKLERLFEQVVRRCGSSRVVERLFDLLHGWSSMAGRSGLPQRSAASAMLANLYLSPVDDVLDYYGSIGELLQPVPSPREAPERRVARWMDDVWLFGEDPGSLRRAQIDVQDALRDLGLNINLAKTAVLEGTDVAVEAKQAEHSAVDGALLDHASAERLGPLNELVDRLLARPETASRTSVRFVTTRVREHEIFQRVSDFAEHADRMPHVADHLARLFRDSSYWREMTDWYVDYQGGPWGTIDWSTAQFGTMFPASASADVGMLKEHLAQRLASVTTLPVLSLAAQRLASWEPKLARVAIREAAKHADSPLHRRTLALAALGADEEPTYVRSLLSEFEENQVTVAMLADQNFKPPKVRSDFEAQ
jgi:hypothetical protein